MKKAVASFIAGVLLTIGATTFADDIQSMIGKKIEGETSVTVDGSSIGSAIIVDGKSYAPIRTIAEASGLTVEYGVGGVVLNKAIQETQVTTTNTGTTTETTSVPKRAKSRLSDEEIIQQIESWKSQNETYQKGINQLEEGIQSGRYSGQQLDYMKDKIEQGKKLIEDNERSIKLYESDLQQ